MEARGGSLSPHPARISPADAFCLHLCAGDRHLSATANSECSHTLQTWKSQKRKLHLIIKKHIHVLCTNEKPPTPHHPSLFYKVESTRRLHLLYGVMEAKAVCEDWFSLLLVCVLLFNIADNIKLPWQQGATRWWSSQSQVYLRRDSTQQETF